MIKIIKVILTNTLLGRAYILFTAMVFAAFLEMIGVGMIPAFVLLLGNPDRFFHFLPDIAILSPLRGLTNPELALSSAVLLAVLFTFKNVYLAIVIYAENRLLRDIDIHISSKLFFGYLTSPYAFHQKYNPAELVRNITKEVEEIRSLLRGCMYVCRESLVLFSVVILLVLIEPLITISIFALLGGAGIGFYLFVRRNLIKKGKSAQINRGLQLKIINQGLGGIKFIKVHGIEHFVHNNFQSANLAKEQDELYQRVIASLPRLYLEVMAIFVVLIMVAVLLLNGRSLAELIPILALQSVAVIRMVPAFNTITASLSMIRYFRASLDLIVREFSLIQTQFEVYSALPVATSISNASTGHIDTIAPDVDVSVELRNVSFSYPESEALVLKNLSLVVGRGESVAIVGDSGAGKSTLLDIILGLQPPTSGNVFVEGRDIAHDRMAIFGKVGFIPQDIYLIDDTIRRNIAFGIPDADIDEGCVKLAVFNAQLQGVIDSLPKGMETVIGDRGIRLSGGQRQRIAIARALYRNPSVLVMDEATSALDSSTELDIMEAIRSISKGRTLIIVAHRLTTVKDCDRIFTLKDGELKEDVQLRNTLTH